MKQRLDSTWQFFFRESQAAKSKDMQKKPLLNRFHHKDLPRLFQFNNKKQLLQFAEELKRNSPLTTPELENVSCALWDWTLNLKNTKYQDITDDLYDIMSDIATFTINQFNTLENTDWNPRCANEASTLSRIVYFLAILSRAHLKTPNLSTRVLNNIGLFLNKSPCLTSSVISHFISGLGMLAKHQKLDDLQLDTALLNPLLTSLANLSWKKLHTKDIAKCLYSLGLLARANCLNNFKPELDVLETLLFIQINLPQLQIYRWSIETSLYSMVILVEHGILNVNDTDAMVLKTLRLGRAKEFLTLTPTAGIKEEEKIFLPNETEEQCVEHLELFNSNSSTIEDPERRVVSKFVNL